MTQPPDPDLPPYGSVPPSSYYVQPYPTPPPGYSQPPQKDRAPDLVLSWILFALQVVGSVAMWLISIFAFVVVTLCEGGSDTCETGAGGVLTGYWFALFALVMITLIGMIVATSTKRRVWPWAVSGFALTVVATIIFFIAIPG